MSFPLTVVHALFNVESISLSTFFALALRVMSFPLTVVQALFNVESISLLTFFALPSRVTVLPLTVAHALLSVERTSLLAFSALALSVTVLSLISEVKVSHASLILSFFSENQPVIELKRFVNFSWTFSQILPIPSFRPSIMYSPIGFISSLGDLIPNAFLKPSING